MQSTIRVWAALVLLASATAAASRAPRDKEHVMAKAAAAFLDTLPPDLRAKAAFPFEDPARLNWHYIPRDHAGVEFQQMNDAQKLAARELLRSALSSRGTNKVEEIMLLDAVLRDIEKGSGPRRDPLAYAVAVYGVPGEDPWGWKIEGHHVSLNFTDAPGGTAITPAFLGANPGEVRRGDRAGVRVLAAEEDIARELLATLSAEQRAEALLGDQAPGDILAIPGRALSEVDGRGLAVSSMTAAQREIVNRLIREYAENFRHNFASSEVARIEAAGIEKVRFAWMGGERHGQGHYYRLSGPTFVIEYDNTQNDANHVHTVWRDRERDFGRDLLQEHLDHDHGAPKRP
ncbi:MAG: DUF3500 domain-containing protein [Phycisphaerales bacterium]